MKSQSARFEITSHVIHNPAAIFTFKIMPAFNYITYDTWYGTLRGTKNELNWIYIYCHEMEEAAAKYRNGGSSSNSGKTPGVFPVTNFLNCGQNTSTFFSGAHMFYTKTILIIKLIRFSFITNSSGHFCHCEFLTKVYIGEYFIC